MNSVTDTYRKHRAFAYGLVLSCMEHCFCHFTTSVFFRGRSFLLNGMLNSGLEQNSPTILFLRRIYSTIGDLY